MDYFRNKINYYNEKNKKSKKLNNTEIGEVVILLKTVLEEDNSVVDEVLDILGGLHYSITAEFVKSAFIVLDGQVKTDFITKYLRNDKIVKNLSNFGFTRNLVIVNELLQTTGNEEFIHMILKVCASKAYGKDGGKKAGELLSKICFDNTNDKLFSLDYSTWQETELRDLSTWIEKTITIKADDRVFTAYKALVERYNLPKGKETDVVVTPSVPEAEDNTSRPTLKAEIGKANPKEKIVVLVSDLQSEVSKIINERLKLLTTIEEAKEKLQQANKDKEGLLKQLSEARTKNDQLQDVIRMKDRKIIDGETKFNEIDDRLKNAFKADKSQQNQELTSLKNDLVKRLKLDYQDYKTLASKEPTPQYYEALVGVIESLFDTLRRKGITINAENEE